MSHSIIIIDTVSLSFSLSFEKKLNGSISTPLAGLIPQIGRHLLVARDEELALRLLLPDQDANLLGVPTGGLELGLGVEVLEQEADGGLHAVAFELPKADLVDDRGREDGLVLGHLRVGVGGEVADDLVARDAHADGAPDRLPRHFAGDHVRVARHEAGEEL